jgi:hypothetical protein
MRKKAVQKREKQIDADLFSPGFSTGVSRKVFYE